MERGDCTCDMCGGHLDQQFEGDLKYLLESVNNN